MAAAEPTPLCRSLGVLGASHSWRSLSDLGLENKNDHAAAAVATTYLLHGMAERLCSGHGLCRVVLYIVISIRIVAVIVPCGHVGDS